METIGKGSRKKPKPSNDDLPHGTLKFWRGLYLPMWIDYVGTLDDIWDLSNLLPVAQNLWNKVFPDCPQDITKDGKIYALLMQRTYEWRSGFSGRAIKAVESYFERYPEQYSDPRDRGDYAEWAAPVIADDDTVTNMPYMWKEADYDEVNEQWV
ncbi:hypothetical protein BJ138DRAFT_1016343 [Hygrophoropsis aurantiaca]|uniref:Uncharacterized protein n=1 Tax=Hygrophoropsis aurantiaca TaxID=72124 RepID=A0ACB7ZZ97_9AGAM|nr:hypothetical protein BJ138DRAFT_1016343 [Hygrophoropsis aurantiaca]